MPRRVRHSKRRRLELTLELALALTIGPRPGRDDDLDDDFLRQVWDEHQARLLSRCLPGDRPWGWWAFEDVPEALRGERPQLVPVEAADAHHAADRELEHRRAAWLAEHTGPGTPLKVPKPRGDRGQVRSHDVVTFRAGGL